jgi:NhaP-type Na+/H+ or K+/H+ antiporter
MAGGSILLGLLLSALLNWLMKKTEESRRKQKQERYKASPIYPYKKD